MPSRRPRPAPAPHLPPELLHSIRPSTWRALFRARGYPPPLTDALFSSPSAAPSSLLSSIASALSAPSPPLPAPLARALFLLPTFASEAARADIYDAAAALDFPARWPEATSPADLIALLLADPAASELVTAAKILRDRAFRPRATFLYVGAPDVDPDIHEPTQYLAAWHREVSAWARSRDFGRVVDVTVTRNAGVVAYEILHEDRPIGAVLASPPDGPPGLALAAPHRPLRSHRVTYERARRRLTVTTDCTEAVTPLARIAGAVLFGAPRHFLDARALDLWRLQEHGPDALRVPALAAQVPR